MTTEKQSLLVELQALGVHTSKLGNAETKALQDLLNGIRRLKVRHPQFWPADNKPE